MSFAYRRRLGALAAAAALITGLTACGGNPSPVPDDTVPTGTTAAAATTTATEAPTTTAAPTTAPPQLGLNPLTGLADMKTDNNRPIGFVITDEDSKHIQLNIEDADLYFEAETEGGIPRILAVFSSVDRMPDRIGPVRSARPHFVKFAKTLDMIYCHIGGSQSGKDAIKNLGVRDLINAYVIDPDLKASQNRSWNRSAFTKKKVLADMQARGYKKTSDFRTPFTFGEKAGTKPAKTVDVRISGSYNMAFTYDDASGLYRKHRSSLDTPVHKTFTGGTVEAANVVVMFDRRFVDVVEHHDDGGTLTRYNFDLKSGAGLLASGGTARDIRWKIDNRGLHYYESDGTTPLTVAPGKTYICLTSKDYQNKTSVR